MLVIEGFNTGKGIGRRRKELWVGDRSSEWKCEGILCKDNTGTNFNVTGRPYSLLRQTIGTLPYYALLEIFNFYVNNAHHDDEWHTLVHVCQKWRNVVFASPRRLGLRLLCDSERSARKMVDIWPKFPIIVKDCYAENLPLQGVDNVLDALKLNYRIHVINLQLVPSLLLEGFATIKEPFNALTSLVLRANDENALVLPDSFLRGSAPRLQELGLDGIPYPAIGKLLLSANDLVSLRLCNIPISGYLSPEEMVTSLSTLTKLKTLYLGFRSPRSGTDRELESRPPWPLEQAFLPTLTTFYFKGDSEYLEDMVSRIDAPLLSNITVTLFNQLTFDTPHLRQFIGRSTNAPFRADFVFFGYRVQVSLFRQNGEDYHKLLELGISCASSDWQLSSLAQICLNSLPQLPTLERLGIHEGRYSQPVWQDDVEDGQWVELFLPFNTVKTLDISETFVGRVVPALQVLSGKDREVTEVLPALQNVFLEGRQPSGDMKDAIGQFAAVRRLPVAVHHRDRGRYWHKRTEDY
jgi:hypothetical protein